MFAYVAIGSYGELYVCAYKKTSSKSRPPPAPPSPLTPLRSPPFFISFSLSPSVSHSLRYFSSSRRRRFASRSRSLAAPKPAAALRRGSYAPARPRYSSTVRPGHKQARPRRSAEVIGFCERHDSELSVPLANLPVHLRRLSPAPPTTTLRGQCRSRISEEYSERRGARWTTPKIRSEVPDLVITTTVSLLFRSLLQFI